MKQSPPSQEVQIGIPAFNEERNIQQLLHSIVKQQPEGVTISRVIVLSDGSSDKTVERAELHAAGAELPEPTKEEVTA